MLLTSALGIAIRSEDLKDAKKKYYGQLKKAEREAALLDGADDPARQAKRRLVIVNQPLPEVDNG